MSLFDSLWCLGQRPPRSFGAYAPGRCLAALRARRAATVERLDERALLSVGIWLTPEEIATLPTSGPAWDTVLAAAQSPPSEPLLFDKSDDTDVISLAKALVGVRLGNQEYLSQVRDTIAALMTTQSNTGAVTIQDPSSLETQVTFSSPGTYLLALTADDGLLDTTDEVIIRVYGDGESFTPTGDPGGTGVVTIVPPIEGSNMDPEVDAGPDQEVSIHDVVTVRGSVRDDGRPDPPGHVTTTWEVVTPRVLPVARNLVSYVIAADLVGLDADVDAQFRGWLQQILTTDFDGRTLQSTHEERPNNWGTMAGATRAAIATYLGDRAELGRTAQVFLGYLGDRSSYAGFRFGRDDSWQADPLNPVPINPQGATKEGFSIDGAQPDDMRRGGSFSLSPPETTYPWEALQGAVVQAEILHRAGYDVWDQQDRALLRAVEFLYGLGWTARGDDEWIPWLIDFRYGTQLAQNAQAGPGKNMGWTAWTHMSAAPAPNQPPQVNAGADQTVLTTQSATLQATVVDDGLPNPPGAVRTEWTVQSAPPSGIVTFADATALETTAQFSTAGTYILRLTANDGALSVSDDASVQVLDPATPITVSFQDEVDGYDGTRDTRIRSDYPTRNFGSSQKLEVDGRPDQASLVRWDLTSLPAGVSVQSVAVSLSVLNTSAANYEIYELLRDWSEDEATHTNASAGVAWEAAGAAGTSDHGSVALGTVTASSTGPATFALNSAGVAAVQSWIDDPTHNFGLIVRSPDAIRTDDFDFRSSEAVNTADRPKLIITYSHVASEPPDTDPPPVNQPPVLAPIGDQSVRSGELLSFTVSASDPEGDALTYTTGLLPDGASFDALTRTFNWAPTGAQVGTHEVTFHVSDGMDSDTETVTIAVQQVAGTFTTSFQDGVEGYSGTRDTRIRVDMPDRNFGSSSKLEVDGNPDFSSLVRWDLTSLPADSQVVSASITLTVVNTSSAAFEMYRLLGDWSEREVTFRQAASGVLWEQPGAAGPTDRDTTVVGTVTAPQLGPVTIELNAAGVSLVQSWIRDPARNYGLILQDYDNESTDDLDFRARESGAGPKLTITYTVGDPNGLSAAPAEASAAAAAEALTEELLAVAAAGAASRLRAQGAHPHAATNQLLPDIVVQLTDLGGRQLGQVTEGRVRIDRDAAGHGWYVDSTPEDDEEFTLRGDGDLRAESGSPAGARFDLVTVLWHEFGHVLGFDHGDSSRLMDELLPLGTRRLPLLDSAAVDALFAPEG